MIDNDWSLMLSPEVMLNDTSCVTFGLSGPDPVRGTPVTVHELLSPDGEQLVWVAYLGSENRWNRPSFTLNRGMHRLALQVGTRTNQIAFQFVNVTAGYCTESSKRFTHLIMFCWEMD